MSHERVRRDEAEGDREGGPPDDDASEARSSRTILDAVGRDPVGRDSVGKGQAIHRIRVRHCFAALRGRSDRADVTETLMVPKPLIDFPRFCALFDQLCFYVTRRY